MKIENKYIILMGKPGSGKGTLAKSITNFVKYEHFVMGDVFRDHMARKTELGVEIQEIMDSGNLVDDSITIRIFKDYIKSLPDGSRVIIDGYPRSEGQLHSLMAVLETPPQIISMDVDDNTCFVRIQKRALVENRTEDADADVIRRRLSIYHKNLIGIQDAMDYYQPHEYRTINLDASKDSKDVYTEYLENLIKYNINL